MSRGEQPQVDDVVPTPPEPPAMYQLLSVPVPMLTVFDSRWIAAAHGPDGIGILIYEHRKQVIFLIADETTVVYSVIAEESRQLINHLKSIDYRHKKLINEWRARWHMLPARHGEGGTQQ